MKKYLHVLFVVTLIHTSFVLAEDVSDEDCERIRKAGGLCSRMILHSNDPKPTTDRTTDTEYDRIPAVNTGPSDEICEAVRRTGGSCIGINTNNPNAGANFSETLFDQGLTNQTGPGGCSGGVYLRSGVEIYCQLPEHGTAHYYYEATEGEVFTLNVETNSFLPEIKILNANGELFYNSYDTNSFTQRIPYSGKLSIAISDSNNQGKAPLDFRVSIQSDMSHAQTNPHTDSLEEYSLYTLAELEKNQSQQSRTFQVKAIFKDVYTPPFCPPNSLCKMQNSPHIYITDSSLQKKIIRAFYSKDLPKIEKLIKGNEYTFLLSVKNTSNTSIPNNHFELRDIIMQVPEDKKTPGCSHQKLTLNNKIQCHLYDSKATYFYDGRKGEELFITAEGTNFNPVIHVGSVQDNRFEFNNVASQESNKPINKLHLKLKEDNTYTIEIFYKFGYRKTKKGYNFSLILEDSDSSQIKTEKKSLWKRFIDWINLF